VDVPLETLVNNACLFNCPWKPAHYNLLAHGGPHQGDGLELHYHWQCMAVRCSEPAELRRLRWIRPEDIPIYADICYFKVVGRYFARQSDLVRAARAYASGQFAGNLWELLGNFAPQRRHGFNIANDRLGGFVDYFCKHPRACADLACNGCKHCRSFAEKAVDAASFDAVRKRLDIAGLQARVDRFSQHGQNPHLGAEEVFWTVEETGR
jgi:hypothetical protein